MNTTIYMKSGMHRRVEEFNSTLNLTQKILNPNHSVQHLHKRRRKLTQEKKRKCTQENLHNTRWKQRLKMGEQLNLQIKAPYAQTQKNYEFESCTCKVVDDPNCTLDDATTESLSKMNQVRTHTSQLTTQRDACNNQNKQHLEQCTHEYGHYKQAKIQTLNCQRCSK